MPIFNPAPPQPLATTDSPTFAAINITGTSDEVLAADFVTTIASAAAVEYLFTAVPVTSGKTYRFAADFYIQWAAGTSSGPASLYDITAEGPLTVDAANSPYEAFVAGAGTASSLGNSVEITESTTWKKVSISGFFKATNSNNFNLGLNIAAWDSGDVVTVSKGALLSVQQVD